MFNVLMQFVFTLVGKIGDIVLAPLILAVSALIPGFSDFVNYIIQFINYGFTYLIFFIKLLMIPKACIQVVLTVATATLLITVAVRAFALIVRIYNYFKP